MLLDRNTVKFDFSKDKIKVFTAPSEKDVRKCGKRVIDEGDAHDLITLDKKHLLVLKGKVKGLTILTPGELIKMLS